MEKPRPGEAPIEEVLIPGLTIEGTLESIDEVSDVESAAAGEPAAEAGETPETPDIERFWQAYKEIKPLQLDLRLHLAPESPFLALATEDFFAQSPSPRALAAVLADRAISDEVRRRAAGELSQYRSQLSQSEVRLLINDGKFLTKRDIGSVLNLITARALNGTINLLEMLSDCEQTINLCDEPTVYQSLLNMIEAVGKDSAPAQRCLIEYGTAAQQAAAWERLTQMDPDLAGWLPAILWVIRNNPDKAERAWQLLEEQSDIPLALNLQEAEVPEALQPAYRSALVRQTTHRLDLLLDYYERWSDQQPVILSRLAEPDWSDEDWAKVAGHRALDRSALDEFDLRAQVAKYPIEGLWSVSEYLARRIVTTTVLEDRLAATQELLSVDALDGLLVRFESKRAAMVQSIIARPDPAGFALKVRLLSLTGKLNREELTALTRAIYHDLESLTLTTNDAVVLGELAEVPEFSALAERRLLELPSSPVLVQALATYWKNGDAARRSRIFAAIGERRDLLPDVMESMRKNRAAWGL